MANRTTYAGDNVSLFFDLTWGGSRFSPGDEWNLIFTCKASVTDLDEDAKIQKQSGLGITVVGDTAQVDIVPLDTEALEGLYVFDIQAQENTSGEVRTLVTGVLEVFADVTNGTTPEIPVHTTNPPVNTSNAVLYVEQTLDAGEQTQARGNISASGFPDAMVVEGATNTPVVNGTYLRAGEVFGVPNYNRVGGFGGVDSLFIWDAQGWGVVAGNQLQFIQDGGTQFEFATPDLVPSWAPSGVSLAPAPTVRRATWPEYLDALGIVFDSELTDPVGVKAFNSADNATLSGSQAFTGAKTFTQDVTISNGSDLTFTGVGGDVNLGTGGRVRIGTKTLDLDGAGEFRVNGHIELYNMTDAVNAGDKTTLGYPGAGAESGPGLRMIIDDGTPEYWDVLAKESTEDFVIRSSVAGDVLVVDEDTGVVDFPNGVSGIPVSFIMAASFETGDLEAGVAAVTFRSPYAFTLEEVRISVNTAPTGATINVDINESGTSVLSTGLSIDIGEKTSTTAAVSHVISDSVIADDAEITIDIDQVGSAIAGSGLKVTFLGTR